ncbi:MAG: HEAT repeat domain-containing protein, partial [Planctomycetes bacterium]|nr:HEAT repeat domain-containing protein [Planctomycetota bacterium]
MGIVLAFALLMPDDWSRAVREFQAAIEASNTRNLEAAIAGVARDNSARAAKLLMAALGTRRQEHYWLLIAGLSKIPSAEGVAEIEKAILSKSGDPAAKRDLMMALQLNGSGPADAALLRIAAEGARDVQITAFDELVKRGKKEAVPVLIDALRKEGKKATELARQAHRSLVNLTGVDVGAAEQWLAWWEKNKDTFKVGDAAKSGGGTVVETVKRNRTTDYEELRRGKKQEIVVVSGIFDEVQNVLERLEVPFTLIGKDDFDRHDLSKCAVLVINCDNYLEKRFTSQQLKRIRAFVADGGYLFTSDWGLVDVLEGAFPGYVKKAGEIEPQMNVPIFPRKGSTGHPFLKEVFVKIKVDDGGGKSGTMIEEKIDHRWEIDPVSYTIEHDPAKVVVLIESPEIQSRYKQGAVAVTFAYGDPTAGGQVVATGGVYEELPSMKGGKVLHILSHFRNQKSKNDDYALQNMFLNFLIEAKGRRKPA